MLVDRNSQERRFRLNGSQGPGYRQAQNVTHWRVNNPPKVPLPHCQRCPFLGIIVMAVVDACNTLESVIQNSLRNDIIYAQFG